MATVMELINELETLKKQLTFHKYSNLVRPTAKYPILGANIVYPAMGLVGEAGEVCEKVKKHWRKTNLMDGARVPTELRQAILEEIGDVLWYCMALSCELNSSLEEIAAMNVAKLLGRLERNTIVGEGDNR
jgi:NTP pyrophosphatase (non-canonical NTP hydrolase)